MRLKHRPGTLPLTSTPADSPFSTGVNFRLGCSLGSAKSPSPQKASSLNLLRHPRISMRRLLLPLALSRQCWTVQIISNNMLFLKILPSLLAIAAFIALYVSLNVYGVVLLRHHGKKIYQRIAVPIQSQLAQLLTQFSPTRIWVNIALYVGTAATSFLLLLKPQSLIGISTILIVTVLIISAITLSLLLHIPLLKKLWEEPVVKISSLAIPPFFAFLAKGYAEMWIGEIFHVSAANLGFTLFAATGFMLFLVVATLLLTICLAIEVATLLALIFVSNEERKFKLSNSVGLTVLASISFLATYYGGMLAFQFPGKPLGRVVLSAIAFEFDASPADYCQPNPSEMGLVKASDPFIKAVHLSSSQEKAILIERSPTLFRIASMKDIQMEDQATRRIQIIRIVDCYSTKS